MADKPPSELNARFLRPAELIVSREACLVTTVLGSCVAVTMFHGPTRLAAICHAILPAPRVHRSVPPSHFARLKFVTTAIAAMDAFFHQMDLLPCEIEVKLFGGARVLCGRRASSSEIGAANVAMSQRLLTDAGYQIADTDVGGTTGRAVIFDTATGVVRVRRLPTPSELVSTTG